MDFDSHVDVVFFFSLPLPLPAVVVVVVVALSFPCCFFLLPSASFTSSFAMRGKGGYSNGTLSNSPEISPNVNIPSCSAVLITQILKSGVPGSVFLKCGWGFQTLYVILNGVFSGYVGVGGEREG